jgi:cell division protein FtsB
MYTQKKAIDNTHIVRERDRQRNRELTAVLFLGAPIGLFLLLFTWQNLEVIRLGREATKLQKDLKQVEAEHKALQAELDHLTSFDAVEQKATTLGFATTDSKAIVIVETPASRQLPTANRSGAR